MYFHISRTKYSRVRPMFVASSAVYALRPLCGCPTPGHVASEVFLSFFYTILGTLACFIMSHQIVTWSHCPLSYSDWDIQSFFSSSLLWRDGKQSLFSCQIALTKLNQKSNIVIEPIYIRPGKLLTTKQSVIFAHTYFVAFGGAQLALGVPYCNT